MKIKATILTAFIIATLATIPLARAEDPTEPTDPADPAEPKVKCHEAPDILNDNVKKCYADECTKFINNMKECAGNELCEVLERLRYELAVGLCANLPAMETSDNLVIWLNAEGDWTVAWPGEEYQIFAPQFDFNI